MAFVFQFILLSFIMGPTQFYKNHFVVEVNSFLRIWFGFVYPVPYQGRPESYCHNIQTWDSKVNSYLGFK